MSMKCYLIVILIHISLMSSDVEYLHVPIAITEVRKVRKVGQNVR